MGQGGAFVELITVRRGAYARRYIQTALKVVAINPRGSPFPVLATRLLLSSVVFPTRCLSVSGNVLLAGHAALPRDTGFVVLIGAILRPGDRFEISRLKEKNRRPVVRWKKERPSKGARVSKRWTTGGVRSSRFAKAQHEE